MKIMVVNNDDNNGNDDDDGDNCHDDDWKSCLGVCAYLAVCAVRGVLIACSIVPGLPLCVPGLTNPLTGRPACDIGLGDNTKKYQMASRCQPHDMCPKQDLNLGPPQRVREHRQFTVTAQLPQRPSRFLRLSQKAGILQTTRISKHSLK